MDKLIILLTSIVFLIGIVTFFLCKHKPKFLWLVPVAATIITGCLFINDVFSYSTSEPTISRKLVFYFHNDVSMGLYLIYAPITGIAIIMTIIAYLLNHYRRKLG